MIIRKMLVVCAASMALVACGTTEEPTEQTTAEPKTTEATPEPKKEKAESKNKVTLENYEKLKVGDTITGEGGATMEEVTALFGSEPDMKSESETSGMKMIVASWNATGMENLGDNVSLTFMNGKLTAKSQFGLEE